MRKNVRSILFVLCIGISFFNKAQAQLLSGNYTIDAKSPSGNRNYTSFGEAALDLLNGISGPVVFTVVQNSGPYNEQITFDSVPGSSATNTITIMGNGNEIYFKSTSTTNRAGIKLKSADYFIIDSVYINVLSTDTTETGYGFHLLNNADNNIIRKCKITNPLYPDLNQSNFGIVITSDDDAISTGVGSFCDNNIITGNTIIGGWNGVMMTSIVYEPPFQQNLNNQITNNIIRDPQGAAIDLTHAHGTLVEGNDISGRVRDGVAGGINLNDNTTGTMIRGNRIHDLYEDPVNAYPSWYRGVSIGYSFASPGKENWIVNNIMYNWRTTGEQEGITLSGVMGVNIYHNTISLEDNNPAANGRTIGFEAQNGNSNVNFKNNIITLLRGGNVNNKGLSIESGIRTFVSDRNILVVGANGASNTFGELGSDYADLAAWQLGTGHDYASSSLDPKYIDMPNGNLMPSDSAVDNMGTYVTVNNDILGATRNNTHPDVGAYEFLTPPCAAPIDGGKVKVLPDLTLCESADLALNLENNSFGSSQTYTWQTSTTETGTYTDISSALAHPAFGYKPASTLYYRAVLTCGSITVYSDTVQVITNPRLAAGTYTINKAQATGGTNFQSFADAVLAMNCGIRGHVVFNVVENSGPYNEQVIINKIPGTSANATVTFNGNGNELNFLSTTSNERAVIKLNNASYITIDSLKIVALGANSGEYGFGVQLFNDADNNTIKRCVVNINTTATNSNFAGIVMSASRTSANGDGAPSYCDSNTVTGNTIVGGQFGITCVSADGMSSTHKNRITNNIVKDFRQFGIYVSGTTNSLIEGNDISRPTRTVIDNDFTGIFADRLNPSLSISKNRIHNTFDGNTNINRNCNGIYMNFGDVEATTPIIVSNNLLYNFNGRGTQNGLYTNNANNVKFYHNTVSLEDSAGVNITSATRGIYIQSLVEGTEVKNNNIVINRNGTGARNAMNLSSADTKIITDYNNFYIKPNVANTSINLVFAYNTSFAALTDWKSDTTDFHSISLYPVYKDAANADFTPDILEFDNKGTNVNITTDINNKTRSTTTPDIGAIEFSKCSSFPVVNVASDSITICSGQPVTFTVSNPEAGTTYNWFNAATNGTQVHSGNSFTVNSVTTPVEYWIEGITTLGCRSVSRKHVEAVNLTPLAAAPVLTIDSVGTRAIRFKWNAVPGATGYQVSRDGNTFTNPSSGATGLTHTITGLNPKDTASLVVKALGIIECQSKISARVQGTTLENPYFIPNTFTPNNNGKNDVFRITSVAIQSLRLMIFNQWGEKIFETTTLQQGWDGTYKGKQQPIGVYVYVARIVLTDGTVENEKGTFNLVR